MAIWNQTRLTQAALVRITENLSGGDDGVPPEPNWAWCPMPGMGTATKLNVDSAIYGDGYIHRSTRGLNPARTEWTMSFPFTSQAELEQMHIFLSAYAAPGFWIRPPDIGSLWAFVTADNWSWTVSDRARGEPDVDYVGTFQATFTQSFNPQPIPIPT